MTQLPIHPQSDQPHVDEFDPANQSLADALRRSFRVLKLLMIVLVALYFLSGWFSVQPNEVAIVTRCGRVLGTGANELNASSVLGPGWHWSWPYPIDQWVKVSTSEREIPVQFMFELSDEEKASGSLAPKYGTLAPVRDDYLITGDVNILHAALVVKYKITDPVAYLANVYPMFSAAASGRAKQYHSYPEYTVLTSIVRDAVIDTAARRNDLEIRGAKQSEFLGAVADCVNAKLKKLASAGAPLGISIDPATGILAPKTNNVEGIMPPRQVQDAFEGVDKALSTRVIMVTKASSDAHGLYLQTAGPDFEKLGDAVQAEFDMLLKASSSAPGAKPSGEEIAKQRQEVETLLLEATGDVRSIIKTAQIKRDQTVKEAAGDYDQFMAVLPEYKKNPEVFFSQILAETFSAALGNREIGKTFVPDTGRAYWLQIPRTPVEATDRSRLNQPTPGIIQDPNAPTMRKVN